MPVSHRPVPKLPRVPRALSIAKDLQRSYPTGKLEYSRAFVGKPMELSICSGEPLPAEAKARLVTSINATPEAEWIELPFERQDDRTLTCRIVPQKPGLFSFWAVFSLDGGQTWNHDPIPDAWVLVDPAQVDQMRLYTLIPNVSGPISEWSSHLERIKAMGFDTVHLLPLTTLDTSHSPYSAKDLFSVDPSYLTRGPRGGAPTGDGLEELSRFVDTAKSLGIRLCFDLVLNHVGVDSNIARRAPEWIMPDQSAADGLRRARYWCDKGWLPWNDLVMIDYEHPSQRIREDIWDYMTEYALFWAHYANETKGFVRFDNLHSSDKGFVDSVSAALRSTYPDVGIIAEYFTDARTLLSTIPQWNLNLILATPWDSRFVPQLREYLKYMHSVSEHVRFFMPITSHDSGTPAQEFGGVESTIPRYVAAALLGTGATGITQGVEFGVKEKINFIGPQPRLNVTGEPMFGSFLRRVNEVLVNEPIFRTGENCYFVDNWNEAIIAAFRKGKRSGEVGCLVACNFDIGHPHDLEMDLSPFLPSGQTEFECLDLMTDQRVTLTGPKVKLTLAPCGVQVLKF